MPASTTAYFYCSGISRTPRKPFLDSKWKQSFKKLQTNVIVYAQYILVFNLTIPQFCPVKLKNLFSWTTQGDLVVLSSPAACWISNFQGWTGRGDVF